MVPPPRARRLAQLFAGLILYGVSSSMLLLAGLGVDPWDVLHQGLSRRLGLGVGTWAIIVGVGVLLLWIPLRQRPGLGTVSNVIVVGLVIDIMLATIHPIHGLPARIAVMVAAVILNGIATGAYIGAGLGPGPRDGLMTGLVARDHSIRVVRTSIELTVLVIGWILGGSVGVGTLVYALGIGPIAHIAIPRLAIGSRLRSRRGARTRWRRTRRWVSGWLRIRWWARSRWLNPTLRRSPSSRLARWIARRRCAAGVVWARAVLAWEGVAGGRSRDRGRFAAAWGRSSAPGW